MGNKRDIDSTENSRVYRLLQRENVYGCPICAPHKGCNASNKYEVRNWKKFRKTQWKNTH